jgi:phosphoribosylamine--glycine ligase
MVFHAGTAEQDGVTVTAGGRVLGVTARAETLEASISRAYDAVDRIHFADAHFRRDIGARALGRLERTP